jgi:hypothetical protein
MGKVIATTFFFKHGPKVIEIMKATSTVIDDSNPLSENNHKLYYCESD